MATETERELEIVQEIAALKEKIKNLNAQEAELAAVEYKNLLDKLDLEQKRTRQLENNLKTISQEIEELEELSSLAKDSNEKSRIEFEIAKKNVELTKQRLELTKATNSINREVIEKEEEALEEAKEKVKKIIQQNENLKKQNELLKEQEQSKEKILSFVNKITGGYSEQIRSLFTMDGIFSSIGSMVKEVVTANENFAKTTGKVSTLTADFGKGFEAYGVGYKEMSESFGTLYTNMASFSNLSKQTQKDLSANAAKMANLGVDAGTTAQNFNILTKSLGVNANEVASINNKLAASAIGAGIAPAKMLKEFGSAMPQLAAYGKQAVNVFIDLQKQAKSLGMEMGTLMGIVGDGFDTFEGAAEKAGKLNAILGGDYLNSVEMLNATESERVEMLKRSFEQSGKNFDSLDKFEKKAIAASLGIKDMNEAGKLFGNTSAEMRAEMQKQAASQKELEKSQKAAADTNRLLMLAMNELLTIAKPVAEIIKTIVTKMAEYPTATIIVTSFVAALVGLGKIIPILSSLKILLGGFGKTAVVAGGEVAAGAGEASGGVTMLGTAATMSAGQILALGAAIALVGVGIGAAAYGVSFLVESFSKLSGEQIFGAVAGLTAFTLIMGAMTVALFALAPAILAAGGAGAIGAPGLLALGTAIALVGAGIGGAAYGMSLLVKSIGELVDKASNIDNLLAISGAIYDISKAILLMPDSKEFNAKVTTLKTVAETVSIAADKAPSLAPATQFVTAAKDYYIAQKDSKAFDQDALVAAIRGIVPTGGTTTGGLAAGTQVVIKIENGKDLIGMVMGRQAGTFNPV
jgi:hypothetical protein